MEGGDPGPGGRYGGSGGVGGFTSKNPSDSSHIRGSKIFCGKSSLPQGSDEPFGF